MENKINLTGIEIIKKYEGLELKPYKCPAGYNTIGYGHVIRKNEKFTHISKQKAESLLISDCSDIGNYINNIMDVELNSNSCCRT
jgi:lysozyme